MLRVQTDAFNTQGPRRAQPARCQDRVLIECWRTNNSFQRHACDRRNERQWDGNATSKSNRDLGGTAGEHCKVDEGLHVKGFHRALENCHEYSLTHQLQPVDQLEMQLRELGVCLLGKLFTCRSCMHACMQIKVVNQYMYKATFPRRISS